MDEPRLDALVGLRLFLEKLKSKELTLQRKGVDVTQDEIVVLKREIAYLERAIARLKGG